MTQEQLISSTSQKLADIVDQYIRESANPPETFEEIMDYTVAAIEAAGFDIVPKSSTAASWKPQSIGTADRFEEISSSRIVARSVSGL